MENPSNPRKHKRRKHSTDKNTDAASPATISAKDMASPPANVEATALDSSTVGTLEKKKRVKKRKKTSDIDSLEITTNGHGSSLVVPENVEASNLEPATERKKKKKKKKRRNKKTTNKIKASNVDSEAHKSSEKTEKTEISCSVEMPNATTLDTEPDVARQKKKRKKKKKKKKMSGDLEMRTVDNEKTLLVPAMVEATVDTTVLDSSTDIAPLEKKKKRKTKKSDDFEMKTLDHENSLVPSHAGPALVTTNMDSVPEIASLEKKEKKKKKKRKAKESVDLEVKIVDHENTVAPSKVDAALDTLNMDTRDEIAPLETKKKRKIKRSNDTADEQPKKNEFSVPTKEESSSETAATVTEKKKNKRMRKSLERNDKVEMASVDNECILTGYGSAEGPYRQEIVANSNGQILESVDLHVKAPKTSDLVLEKPVELLDDKGITISSSDVELKDRNVPQSLPHRSLVSRSRKKLLILDVNGILVDFVNYNPAPNKADIVISKKYVFKRPYCDEFLKFCFERFDVGVWSSRIRWNMEKTVDFLFWEYKDKLLFCWDQSHCTMTGFNTIDNQSKPLVLKELKNVWQKLKPGLPFGKGAYDETNTVLLDDSPYKALRNPANTAIFPNPYSYTDKDDNALGPDGDLRAYLECLSNLGNVSVRKYVEQNPFGQPAVTESHKSWDFYSKMRKGSQILGYE